MHEEDGGARPVAPGITGRRHQRCAVPLAVERRVRDLAQERAVLLLSEGLLQIDWQLRIVVE
jgi:hypothetical protein